MENAGRGVAELLLRLGVTGPVVVCCGKGNNGGDGFVIARHLDNAGVAVRVLLFARPEDLHGDAAVKYRILERSGPPIEILPGSDIDETSLRRELETAEWVVDALFGSGLQGPVRPPFDQIIAAINASGARVLAVDIPSGLDADTGQPLGPTIRAHAHRDHRGGQEGLRAAGSGGVAGTGPCHRHGSAATDASLRLATPPFIPIVSYCSPPSNPHRCADGILPRSPARSATKAPIRPTRSASATTTPTRRSKASR